ncbi:hypothetical protein BESB_016460 [Besnoitia besnoiti]|uniref:C protein immunoglobulin-A-binding beta antigen n=1 Tax=Besnoitia besnoiti TaxID=94643 RepID=A0A2A9M1E7_BESBE|nr:hypothetical protein BESB_016460 [Besnoitia besnoiti]PFH32328.1 hypothetical protein BESB_016460 [Besnoitia besnoiti]
MPPLLPVLPVIPFPAPGLEPTVPPFPITLPTPLPGVPPIAPFPPVPPVEPAPGQPPVLPEPVLPIILPYLIPSPSPLELLSGRGTFNFSGLPSLGEIPELRGLPNLRELPDFPGLGQLPHLPSLGELPQLPQLPGLGELPQLPQLPGLPNLPRIPGLADRPRIPGIGELPQIPGLGDYIRPPPATSPNVNAFGNFTGIELPGLPSLTELLREPANIDRIQKTIQEALRQVAADPLNLERLRQSFQDLLGLIAPQEMFQLQQHAMAKKQIEVFEVKLSAKDILDSTERVAEKLAAAKAVKMDDASIANIGSLGDIPEIRALDESFQRLRTVLEQLLAPLTQLLAGLDLPRLPSVA